MGAVNGNRQPLVGPAEPDRAGARLTQQFMRGAVKVIRTGVATDG
ncbi:hypothetical protein I549_4508 [Mycobacterium avium subsp. avium 2285 (R)]|nr:hypothetical protein I549_4508 [Mycobacterium avium subsp. avium 2285 (R)]